MSFVIMLAVATYVLAGLHILRRGMGVVHAQALSDQQYFVMAVQDGRSLSMLLPKIVAVLFWPAILAFALLARLFTPAPSGSFMAS